MVGTGPSLTGFDWTRLNGKCTIALNDAVLVPGYRPTYALFSDTGIWTRYRDMELPAGTKMVCQKRARESFLRYEPCSFKDRTFHYDQTSDPRSLKEEDDSLYVQRTIATGAICLAWKLGARRIFLLGVDGYKYADRYYHDGTSKRAERRKERKLDQEGRIIQDRHEAWVQNMDELREWMTRRRLYTEAFMVRDESGKRHGEGIFNLSGHSAVKCFQKVKLKTLFRNPR